MANADIEVFRWGNPSVPLTFRFRYRSKSRSTLTENRPPRSRVLLLAYSRNSSTARFSLARIEHLPRATSDERLVAPAEAPVSFMRASGSVRPCYHADKIKVEREAGNWGESVVKSIFLTKIQIDYEREGIPQSILSYDTF